MSPVDDRPAEPGEPGAETGDGAALVFADPADLAHRIAAAPRPILIGLDIDGVLSPLVDHADDARLLDGMADAVAGLEGLDGVVVAAISGRALDSMRTFGLPAHVRLIGSHGMEADDSPRHPLDESESARLAALSQLAADAAASAGEGAWVEPKFASVAVHVRTADPAAAADAFDRLRVAADDVDGATYKPGSNVLELFARHASKGTAMTALREATAARTALFIGDDVTDEEAFGVLAADDISIKVGTAATVARWRLRGPSDVRTMLTALSADRPTTDRRPTDD